MIAAESAEVPTAAPVTCGVPACTLPEAVEVEALVAVGTVVPVDGLKDAIKAPVIPPPDACVHEGAAAVAVV